MGRDGEGVMSAAMSNKAYCNGNTSYQCFGGYFATLLLSLK